MGVVWIFFKIFENFLQLWRKFPSKFSENFSNWMPEIFLGFKSLFSSDLEKISHKPLEYSRYWIRPDLFLFNRLMSELSMSNIFLNLTHKSSGTYIFFYCKIPSWNWSRWLKLFETNVWGLKKMKTKNKDYVKTVKNCLWTNISNFSVNYL